jgi:hypothetical protein
LLAFVADVQVLMHASGLSDEPHHAMPCADLLQAMRGGDVRLVLDSEDLIRNHYAQKLGRSFGALWVAEMASHGKVEIVKRAHINRGVSVKLAEAGFHPSKEDYKYYVRTAAAIGACLVTCDPHAHAVARTLKEIGVTVLMPLAGHQHICDAEA